MGYKVVVTADLNKYFMMYRIVEDIVYVDNIFHELQDYENKMV